MKYNGSLEYGANGVAGSFIPKSVEYNEYSLA
jgi:hypothetical protein